MSDSRAASLYTIAPDQPFLTVLADSLIDDDTRGALFGDCALDCTLNWTLEEVLILLPTRRAARELAQLFLARAEDQGRTAILLPRIATLGDVDETDLEFETHFADARAQLAVLDLPPAIAPWARHFHLLPLVTKLTQEQGQNLNVAQLSALVSDLENFLDQAQNEQIDWHKLPNLVPDSLAANWQQTLVFLKIITEAWPAYLRDNRLLDPVARRNALLGARAAHWHARPPDYPVIAAGSTGSVRATAELLKVIAGLPRGAVILPGLDQQADDTCWHEIEHDPSHPQMSMAQLLTHMEQPREAVRDWPGSRPVGPSAQLVQAALVPARQTARWAMKSDKNLEITHIHLIEAPDQRAEAGAIALAMREVYEGAHATPSRSAALVTRDRRLARRVAAELRRWDIIVDDSAGQPLAATPKTALLRLILRCWQEDFAPVALLALLKHPLVCLRQTRIDHLARVRKIERATLRGPRPAPGLDGLRYILHQVAALQQASALRQANSALHQIGDAEDAFIETLATAFAPLLQLPEPAPLQDHLVALHAVAGHMLAGAGEEDEASGAFFTQGAMGGVEEVGEEGRQLKLFFDDLTAHAALLPVLSRYDWPELFDLWLSRQSVRHAGRATPGLFIWGPLEARLMQADVMILGGLNETSWPPLPETGPWLSRPMRAAVGLSLPERQIGMAAHDFVQGASAPLVYLTRAAKIDGSPSVAARWLRRLETLCGGLPRHRGKRLLALWVSLDQCDTERASEQAVSASRPAPCPPLAARPDSLSVTQIERLLFNPYAVYASQVLRLRELAPVDQAVGAAHRGSLLHTLFERLIKEKRHLHDGLAKHLLVYADEMRETVPGGAAVMRFWQARLAAVAQWFEVFEADRRDQLLDSHAEIRGALRLEIAGSAFTLLAKADRIDKQCDGSYVIIDYKTGKPPNNKDVTTYLAPQLTLEALILQAGGFADAGLPAGPVSALDYLWLNGRNPPGKLQHFEADPALIDGAREMLENLITTYRNPAQPYTAHIRKARSTYPSQYDHLARLGEWRSALDEGLDGSPDIGSKT